MDDTGQASCGLRNIFFLFLSPFALLTCLNLSSVLSQHPDSNLVVISDIFSEPKTKLEVDPKVKSKVVRPVTSQPATKPASFHLLWKTSHEGRCPPFGKTKLNFWA